MKNLAKWLLRKIKEVDLIDVLQLIRTLLSVERVIDSFCDWLAGFAKKTETQIDDQFVVDLRSTLKQLLLGKIS